MTISQGPWNLYDRDRATFKSGTEKPLFCIPPLMTLRHQTELSKSWEVVQAPSLTPRRSSTVTLFQSFHGHCQNIFTSCKWQPTGITNDTTAVSVATDCLQITVQPQATINHNRFFTQWPVSYSFPVLLSWSEHSNLQVTQGG